MTVALTSVVRAEDPDQSTPKKAALAPRQSGDGEVTWPTVKAVATGTDAEFAIVKQMSDLVGSAKNLETAAVKKFGDEAKLPKEMAMDLVGDMESAEEKIDGDNATLALKSKPDDKFPPTLKKVGDKWTVDLSNLSKDPQTGPMTKLVPAMVKILDTVAKNTAEDKYKTTVELYTAMGTQMSTLDAMTSAPAPEAAK